jgi:hypothetical protein
MGREADGAWDELERGFFEAAPPDVPLPPPAAPRFDDLEAPARRSPRAAPRSSRRERPARARRRPSLRALAAALAAGLVVAAGAGAYWTRDRSTARAFRFGVGGGGAVICQAAIAARPGPLTP